MIRIRSIGSISPAGYDPSSVISFYTERKGRFSQHEKSGLAVGRLSEAAETALLSVSEDRRYAKLDKTTRMAIYAARKAVEHFPLSEKKRICVNIASSRGAAEMLERSILHYASTGTVGAHTSPVTTLGNISAWVAEDLSHNGAAFDHSMTCSSSHFSILNGVAWINSGMADCYICGGSEAPITNFTIEMMRSMGVYSKLGPGSRPCRPFSGETDSGMVLSEGAGVIIMDKSQTIRGDYLAELIAVGCARERIHSGSDISEGGDGMYTSMGACLNQIKTGVDVVITHAPGTIRGDDAELNAINRLFGSSKPLVLTNKDLIGHTLGSSGILGVEYAILLLTGRVRTEYLGVPPRTVMVNSAGFGGSAVTLVLTK